MKRIKDKKGYISLETIIIFVFVTMLTFYIMNLFQNNGVETSKTMDQQMDQSLKVFVEGENK